MPMTALQDQEQRQAEHLERHETVLGVEPDRLPGRDAGQQQGGGEQDDAATLDVGGRGARRAVGHDAAGDQRLTRHRQRSRRRQVLALGRRRVRRRVSRSVVLDRQVARAVHEDRRDRRGNPGAGSGPESDHAYVMLRCGGASGFVQNLCKSCAFLQWRRKFGRDQFVIERQSRI
jgi:hypothetical protein